MNRNMRKLVSTPDINTLLAVIQAIKDDNPTRMRLTFVNTNLPVKIVHVLDLLVLKSVTGFSTFKSDGLLSNLIEQKFYPFIDQCTHVEVDGIHTEPMGSVEGRPVFLGDKLYIDIRETCATNWGEPKVPSYGVNEGQGQIIVFNDGDYRMCDDLVWEPKELPVRKVTATPPASALHAYKNPDQYTKEQLSSILEAFFDIADGMDADDFVRITGNSCTATAENFVAANNLVSKRWGR